MVPVRSVRICTFIAEVNEDCSMGSICLTWSATLMMLAPGWRWIFMMTAGVAFTHAACFTFSALSTAVAISESRTGAPLRYAMTTSLYCLLEVN